MANKEKVIVVTGGSKGLGKGIVEELLHQGYSVATFSRSKTKFIEKHDRKKGNKKFFWKAVDGTNYQEVNHFIKTTYQKFSRIDGLINNAGIAIDGLLPLISEEGITRTISLNLVSNLKITQSCIKYMLPKKSGVIINISSIAGIRGYSGLSVYSATKAAIDGLTRTLARELGPRGIRVNSISPGYFKTALSSGLKPKQLDQIIRRTPLGRLGEVEDIVGAVTFLLSPGAQFITGQSLVIDGGITC